MYNGSVNANEDEDDDKEVREVAKKSYCLNASRRP